MAQDGVDRLWRIVSEQSAEPLDFATDIYENAINAAAGKLTQTLLLEFDAKRQEGGAPTREQLQRIVERLRQFRIDVEAEDLVTAPVAAATWLRERQIRTVALYVENAGRADFDEFRVDERSPGAVVVGDIGSAWTFDLLNRAFRQLLGGAELLAIQWNRYWKTADGFVLDAGPFVAALEYASGKQAVTIGKPSVAFFEAAARSLGLPMSKLVMVGDDVVADVEGAIATGLQGVLVRTGKFRPSDLERETPLNAVLDSIAELPRLLFGGQ